MSELEKLKQRVEEQEQQIKKLEDRVFEKDRRLSTRSPYEPRGFPALIALEEKQRRQGIY